MTDSEERTYKRVSLPSYDVIHSAGLLNLNFLGPYELGESLMTNYAADLLNEAKNGVDYQH
jgi:hypothetical protein